MEYRRTFRAQRAMRAADPWPNDEEQPTAHAMAPAAGPSAGPLAAALKRQILAAEYRGRAQEASALAAASLLDRVREKHEEAAARWRSLAALSERDRGVEPLHTSGGDTAHAHSIVS